MIYGGPVFVEIIYRYTLCVINTLFTHTHVFKYISILQDGCVINCVLVEDILLYLLLLGTCTHILTCSVQLKFTYTLSYRNVQFTFYFCVFIL